MKNTIRQRLEQNLINEELSKNTPDAVVSVTVFMHTYSPEIIP